MSRPFNIVRVDLAALAHNLDQVRQLVGSGIKVMAVVKADAYGHGLVPVGRHLAQCGADALGVMDLHEAVLLRDAGVDLPIFILAGVDPQDCGEVLDRDLTPFVYELGLARALNEAARSRGRLFPIHLKMDTGMYRLGATTAEGESFLKEILGLKHLAVTGLATHFADADLKDGDFIELQLSRLEGWIGRAREMGFGQISLNNAANSAAVLSLPRAHLDMVRPGLMLYGDYPAEHLKSRADLKPAMSMVSQVIQVKKVPAGGTVSYGRTWTADRETVIAVLPLGYTHGFKRLFSNNGWALIRGQRAPIRGRVCMNLTMFDVTDIPGVVPGDEAVLLGSRGGETITGGDLAELAGTISYEIFCNLGSLNRREYV
jgi:alanine racemase